ncbi:MAG: hypothetical protein ACT4OY_01380 [Alphaproteobacteria bacterium]
MKHILPLLFIIIFLAACGTTGPVNLSTLNEPVPANKARIVVTRNSSLLYLVAAVDIRSNGTKIASLGIGGSVAHDIHAGANVLEVSTPTAPGQFIVRFDAKPGHTYHFKVSPRSGQLLLGSAFGLAGDAVNASISDTSGYFQLTLEGAN